MIYEPGNGGTSDAAWHTETVADVHALITVEGDVVTSVQTGIGSHMEISAPSARHRLRFRGDGGLAPSGAPGCERTPLRSIP